MRKGVIFDVDGTLWDSSSSVAESWNEVIKETFGEASFSDETLKSVMGLSMDEIAKRLFPHLSEEERTAIAKKCMAHENKHLLTHPGVLYPHLEECLKELKEKGYELAILSNAQSGYVEAMLEASHLGEYFVDHIAWGDNPVNKAKNMLLLKERNHWDECLYVGDTELDERETHLAKMPFIYCAYGFGKAIKPEKTVHSPLEIVKAVEDLL